MKNRLEAVIKDNGAHIEHLFKYFGQFYCLINFKSRIMYMYNHFFPFLLRFTFCEVKWEHFKGVVEKCYKYLAVILVSFLTVRKLCKSFNS